MLTSDTGGNSWFASRYGFVCDNVINFEVVLSSGEVINANTSIHADLYKALKGGGNNFGVVTRFDYETFEQGLFWGGFVIMPNNETENQLRFLQEFTTASGEGKDDYAALESIHAFNSTGRTALASIIAYTKPVEYPPIFAVYKDNPKLMSDLRMTNLSNLTVEAGGGGSSMTSLLQAVRWSRR